MTRTHRITLIFTLGTVIFSTTAWGGQQCPTTFKPGAPFMISSVIRLEVERGFPSDLLQEAIAFWENCPSYGSGFPRFVTGGEGDFVFSLRLEKNRFGGGYCAYISGDEIVVFKTVRDANGKIRSCGSLAENLAHELGHLLDLEDAGRDPACQRHLMGSLYSWKLDSKKRKARGVHDEVCQVLDEHWLTWQELRDLDAVESEYRLASRD